MQLIRGLHNLPRFSAALENGCAMTIGNFDGVHSGHLQVLKALRKKAEQLAIPSVVMIFEPLPIEFFSPQKAPVRLMNLREKLKALTDTGIDYVICVHFNQLFAELSAAQFIDQVLVKQCRVRHLVVGDDFRFGKSRQGDFALLQSCGQTNGFEVVDMPTFDIEGERVSSTRIRQALIDNDEQRPDLAQVKKLLGREFTFNGRVIHGQKLGRTIGFPTLNINPKRKQMPVMGVFAVRVNGLSDKPWPGVANIGIRPTIEGLRPSIEVHLFDWQEDVYGRHIEVVLQQFIRPEMKFNGLDELQKQIQIDAQAARQLLQNAGD
ncbi:bifunctional riboflavin kinase/FAD synthetase [Thiomicrorhabdus sediminis]|uniref:Riboflavin biosynthesis protein n=1 Tax=Thiomicrorhabdus sediminis TaxID=2580412 RepID=A0A4P9K8H5_9GAMM|nr:bifunctional riboflavin kinase/FAD synthetase [Thiomicrorhabdus sediminis]QCU90760.1 bifunctional riboflavin kinase/FAD synthetase [Thiomicrorhabdus sediminis]